MIVQVRTSSGFLAFIKACISIICITLFSVVAMLRSPNITSSSTNEGESLWKYENGAFFCYLDQRMGFDLIKNYLITIRNDFKSPSNNWTFVPKLTKEVLTQATLYNTILVHDTDYGSFQIFETNKLAIKRRDDDDLTTFLNRASFEIYCKYCHLIMMDDKIRIFVKFLWL